MAYAFHMKACTPDIPGPDASVKDPRKLPAHETVHEITHILAGIAQVWTLCRGHHECSLAIDLALERLAALDERKSGVFEMRFLVGLEARIGSFGE
jgi:hypothetical protein